MFDQFIGSFEGDQPLKHNCVLNQKYDYDSLYVQSNKFNSTKDNFPNH